MTGVVCLSHKPETRAGSEGAKKMAKKIKLILTENQADVLMLAMQWAIGTVEEDFKDDSPELYAEMKKMVKLETSLENTIQKHYAKAGE